MTVFSCVKLLKVSTANFTRAQAAFIAINSLMKGGGFEPSDPLYWLSARNGSAVVRIKAARG